MRTVAVYPGRFHIFHQGHRAVYDHLTKQYGQENVYIATSAKQNDTDSPFTFSDKVAMMTKMGVPASRIIQVTNPYKIKEMETLLGLDPATDHLVYALGEKDASRFKYTPESPLQLLSTTKKMKPVGKHAYVEVVPTATFNVLGRAIQNASEIRKMYLEGNENDRMQIIADLYGATDPELKAMFDQRLGANKPKEAVIYGKEAKFAGEQPASVMRENRIRQLQENIQFLKHKLTALRESQDYINERRPRKK
jgi:nicotinamide mononucleotide adenylyltransferase